MTKKQLEEYRITKREIEEERERIAQFRSSKGNVIAHEVERKIANLEKRQIEVEKFVSAIEDSFIRRIVVARYIEGRSWVGVARKLGGGNTSDGVRKIWERWARRNL